LGVCSRAGAISFRLNSVNSNRPRQTLTRC
jgi:hypothetical protein